MQNQNVSNGAALLGRIMLALIFVVSGFGKLTGYEGTAAYMAGAGLPAVTILLPLTILIELGGGLLLMIGWRTRMVATIMFLFLIPVTLVFHGSAADPAQARMQAIHLMKNISIMGGMLMLVAFGPGGWSVDGRKRS